MRSFVVSIVSISLVASAVFAHSGVKNEDVMKRMKQMCENGFKYESSWSHDEAAATI